MLRCLAAPALVLALLAAPAFAEVRQLAGFDSVNAQDQLRVEVVLGQTYAVNVTGSDAARVRTEIQAGALKISQRNRPWFGRSEALDATVHVTMPRVEGLGAARGAVVHAADIRAQDMSLAAAMGGAIEISGTCTSLDVAVAMGGEIDARGFQCNDAHASAAMGGQARIYADHSLDASAAMGGVVNVDGHPPTTDVSTAMGGEVNR